MKITIQTKSDQDFSIDSDKTIQWHKRHKHGTDILHRAIGPAIEYADGSKEWCLDGKRHRADGPAIESANGHKEWFLDGKNMRIID